MSNNKGITDNLRGMKIGDAIHLCAIERPNIHSLAKRALRQVKTKKERDGSFIVTCVGILETRTNFPHTPTSLNASYMTTDKGDIEDSG